MNHRAIALALLLPTCALGGERSDAQRQHERKIENELQEQTRELKRLRDERRWEEWREERRERERRWQDYLDRTRPEEE